MPQEDVMQIKVGRYTVGMIGLRHVMEEMAPGWAHRRDEDVQTELLKRLSGKNYIPANARDHYGKALLLEFNKFLGKPYEEESPEGLDIKVLGPGCYQCDKLERDLIEIMVKMDMVVQVSLFSTEEGRPGSRESVSPLAICPSTSLIWRLARFPICSSWVTTTRVMPSLLSSSSCLTTS